MFPVGQWQRIVCELGEDGGKASNGNALCLYDGVHSCRRAARAVFVDVKTPQVCSQQR